MTPGGPAAPPADRTGAAGEGLAVRDLALRSLHRVNHQGAFSNLLIEAELARGRLAGPDRGLYVRLVRGTLERQGAIDWALRLFLQRKLESLDVWPLEALRLGAYQLLYLDLPPWAVVDTSVQLARRLSGRGASGLVNAVLRRLGRSLDKLPWPDRFSDPLGYLSVRESHPRWLVARWLERFGPEEATALCQANNTVPGVTIRVNLLRTTREALASALSREGIQATPGHLAPESLHVTGGADLHRLEVYRQGAFTVQDEASMLVARALDPAPGEKVVDACAAPGGKTTHLAALARDRAQVLAVDVNRAKLSQVRARARLLGLESVTTMEGDARTLGALMPAGADALLLDAPCSGMGVLRRRPEVRWRRQPGDLHSAARRQLELLDGVAPAVKHGGRLVYAVCSFEPEETVDVLFEFLASPVGRCFSLAAPSVTLLPHVHGTDGFFYAALCREAAAAR
ncbi:MAG: 16S rRNA (cytosine(967)-C(5))-methyltransferase RsmB [Bacillota bacterium]|nr:16S rRNA (cytosine(967)-C(5))-methyltransferase RsmB [Bacillota bacterium]